MQAVVDAVVARLAAAGLAVHDTVVDGTTDYPYALVWATPSLDRPELALAGQRGAAGRIAVTCTGLSAASVRHLAAGVFAALDGWTPGVLGGLRCDELRFADGSSAPLTADLDTPKIDGQRVLYGVDFYRVSATPL